MVVGVWRRHDGDHQLSDRPGRSRRPGTASITSSTSNRRSFSRPSPAPLASVQQRQPHRSAEQRRRVLPRDAARHRRRAGVDHHRGVHLLGRGHRPHLREGARRTGPGGCQSEDPARRHRVEQHRHTTFSGSSSRMAARSRGTTRSSGTASAGSTTGRTASRSSSTAASASRAAPASPTSGVGMRRTRNTGGTCRSASRGRP